MKKILVTGATGFIGSKLIPKLIKNYQVICFVRKTDDIEGIKKFNIQFAFGDMFDKDSLMKAVKNMGAVIHLATAHLPGKEEMNLLGSKNIIEACEKNKVKRVIFISSMATKRKNIDEYGKIKLKIENLIQNADLDYTILRPSIIYSKNNLSLIGKTLSFPLFIPIIGNGKYKMNPLYIEDLINTILKVIENKKSVREDYDVAGGEKISFNEIIKICKNRFNVKKPMLHLPIPLCLLIFKFFPIVSSEAIKGIKEDTNADITKLKRDLKIEPINFREGIKNVNL